MQITILPLKGVLLEDRILPLGCRREEALALVGPAQTLRGSLYCLGGELRLDFDRDDRLEFIEFLAGPDGRLRPVIYGEPAFQTRADALARLLAGQNDGPVIDDEQGYSCAFCSIGVGVFRESTPESVRELQAELEAMNSDSAQSEDLVLARTQAAYWTTIGLGGAGYYKP